MKLLHFQKALKPEQCPWEIRRFYQKSTHFIGKSDKKEAVLNVENVQT